MHRQISLPLVIPFKQPRPYLFRGRPPLIYLAYYFHRLCLLPSLIRRNCRLSPTACSPAHSLVLHANFFDAIALMITRLLPVRALLIHTTLNTNSTTQLGDAS